MSTESEQSIDDGHPELPQTDIGVQNHIHFGMTGSFPLRLAEIFFVEDGLYIAEYSKITPFFGLMSKQPGKDAMAMQSIYERDGIDGVLLAADRLLWFNHEMIDKVKLVSGGWLGYPKVTVYAEDSKSYAYRIHGTVGSFDEMADGVIEWANETDVDTMIGGGLGISIHENIVRFFWQ